MAVEEINAAGRIKSLGGAQIKMVYAYSKGNPVTEVAEAERLITQEKESFNFGFLRRNHYSDRYHTSCK